MTENPPVEMLDFTSSQLANILRKPLAELGTDVDQLPEEPHELGALIHRLKGQQREMFCDLLSLRAGRSGRDWPQWLDKLHDEAIEGDAIDRGRKTLADHLDAIISEIRQAQRARRELQGEHGSAMWDVEHAEGGSDFQHALDQLAFYAAAAKALNPTRDM